MKIQMQNKNEFERRLEARRDELKWLYMELYQNEPMFQELLDQMKAFYKKRKESLKERDRAREKDKEWYRKKDMLGMMLYIDNFAGT